MNNIDFSTDIDEYLKNGLLKDVKFKWKKANDKPHGSYGLSIHSSTMQNFATNLLVELQKYDLDFLM